MFTPLHNYYWLCVETVGMSYFIALTFRDVCKKEQSSSPHDVDFHSDFSMFLETKDNEYLKHFLSVYSLFISQLQRTNYISLKRATAKGHKEITGFRL